MSIAFCGRALGTCSWLILLAAKRMKAFLSVLCNSKAAHDCQMLLERYLPRNDQHGAKGEKVPEQCSSSSIFDVTLCGPGSSSAGSSSVWSCFFQSLVAVQSKCLNNNLNVGALKSAHTSGIHDSSLAK